MKTPKYFVMLVFDSVDYSCKLITIKNLASLVFESFICKINPSIVFMKIVFVGAILFSGCDRNKYIRLERTVSIPAGEFIYENPLNGEKLTFQIDALKVDAYEVSLTEFAEFITETGYVTTAEHLGGSYILSKELALSKLNDGAENWWVFEEGITWRDSFHPDSKDVSKSVYPVTHVSYEDALAYCSWKGARLPYSIEWQYIRQLNGETKKHNTWQGIFPLKNNVLDGHEKTAPVKSFDGGKLGIYNLRGNVWEWCADYYHLLWFEFAKERPLAERLLGSSKSYDPINPHGTFRVICGGSYLCADNYCQGDQIGKLHSAEEGMSFEHIGFRCVRDRK